MKQEPKQPGSDQPVVFIVDDDQEMRESLGSLLRSVQLKVKLFSSTAELLETGEVDAHGCLILDVRLPGVSGLDFQQQLARAGILLPIIFLTGYGDVTMSVRAMKAGAADFLTKPFRDQDLLDAVTAALEGDRKRRVQDAALDDVRARYEALKPREKEVMALVTRGLMNKQVAGELGLSEITVKIHRGNAMQKMKARTLPDLVRMAEMLAPKE
ncbi:response regulator transcription factor [Martelella soudanensis]|uniref:response regulator transcription factor n=1 Tax=unclassified Martelella TaxID=2629616 RepID=UPI0015DF59BF|nr:MULTISPECIES: response regulator transcription factor [unclassified Martelella]